ncbi:MAG: FUSC family protein, partial [Candidatus Obscuribacterales bacterium]|nr:FUSC family protein [Candidatus Obscuribacterales bacterium]
MFSTIYYLYFVISGLIGIVIATIIRLVTFPFDPDALILHRIASLWIYHYLRLNPGWKIELSGDENIDKNTTYV